MADLGTIGDCIGVILTGITQGPTGFTQTAGRGDVLKEFTGRTYAVVNSPYGIISIPVGKVEPSLGSLGTGITANGKFTTYRPQSAEPYSLVGGSVVVYKNNDLTPSSAGVTLTSDFNGEIGLNNYEIDFSADSNFYSTDSFFQVVIASGTVDGVTAAGVVGGDFSINIPSSINKAGLVHGKFTTFLATTGEPYSLTNGELTVYKNNSLTQNSNGVTLVPDFNGVVGLNQYTVDTTLDSDFYSNNSFFNVVVSNGTIADKSVVGSNAGGFTKGVVVIAGGRTKGGGIPG